MMHTTTVLLGRTNLVVILLLKPKAVNAQELWPCARLVFVFMSCTCAWFVWVEPLFMCKLLFMSMVGVRSSLNTRVTATHIYQYQALAPAQPVSETLSPLRNLTSLSSPRSPNSKTPAN